VPVCCKLPLPPAVVLQMKAQLLAHECGQSHNLESLKKVWKWTELRESSRKENFKARTGIMLNNLSILDKTLGSMDVNLGLKASF
jgi:hypothetical protein